MSMHNNKWTIIVTCFLVCTALTFWVPQLNAKESTGDIIADKPASSASSDENTTDDSSVQNENLTTLFDTTDPYLTEGEFEITEETEDIPAQRILISLVDQRMWVFGNGEIIQRFLVSTGVPGHRTPTGNYSVRNQWTRAYSHKYDAWMLNWMGITPDGMYGMHALAGNSYLRYLGSVASHGCIRLSHEDALWLYEWIQIGTPVEIVDDWEEPVEEPEPAKGSYHEVYPFL